MTLAATAEGRIPAETVIRDARLVNVCTGEIQGHTDVAIAQGRIALVGDGSHCIGPDTRVIEAEGQYIAPGFMDGHIHVESSMMGVGEYARAVIPHGTVGIYMDPHEICNVLGLEGVGDLLAGHCAEQPPAVAALGHYLHGQLLELGGGGLCLRLLGGLLGLFGLLLHLHGIDVLRRGGHRQLPGQEKIAGVAVACLDHLALLALALHVLL
mgnify:CR=1 FL=1